MFLHEKLRRLEPPAAQNEGVDFMKSIMGKWCVLACCRVHRCSLTSLDDASSRVRIVISDKRAFVGVLEAVDGDLNMVLGNPVEVRPAPKGGADETKSHRGSVTINGRDIEHFGLYNRQ